MQLQVPSILSILALVTATTADTLIVDSVCLSSGSCNHSGTFVTGSGSYDINADGCPSTTIPGVLELCVDWDNERAHFLFDGQSKRCMSIAFVDVKTCADLVEFESATCTTETFEEVPCTWDV